MTSRLMGVMAGLVLALAMSGCGDAGTTTVTGKVTFNSRPVVWGSVTLVDGKGQYHQGPIDLDGNYSIENVPTGTVKISVFSSNPDTEAKKGKAAPVGASKAGEQPDDPRAKFKTNAPETPKPPPGAWFPIPEKYTDPVSSGLTGEVKKGQTLNIDLK